MVHALFVLAAEAAEEAEKSETPFYIAGCVFAAWAVIVGTLGIRSESFGSTRAAGTAMIGVSVVLAVLVGSLIIYVST